MTTWIAEIGVNHHGDMEKAFRMVEKAIDCGATLVKGQYYDPVKVLGRNHVAFDYAVKCQFTKGQHEALAAKAELRGGRYFVSVFNIEDIKWASQFGYMKIATRMNRRADFISLVEHAKLPTYMSVQPQLGVRIPKRFNLLWCLAQYPATKAAIVEYPYQGFGLSSHCPDPSASLEAWKKGARVIENHLAESRDESGCDISSSLTFDEYKKLINDCH